MKRNEIEIGTEYAMTGALAYGQEPRVAATRVRFVSKTPCSLVRTYIKSDQGLSSDQLVQTAFAHGVLQERTAWLQRSRVEKGEQYEEVVTIKGGLPAEVLTRNGWVQGIVAPAAVHRTWAEHEDNVAESRARYEARRLEQAPSMLRRAVREALDAARLVAGPEATDAEVVALVLEEAGRR